MRTRIQRWGNSLALRIPKSIAAEARLEPDMAVEVTVSDGKLIVAPLDEPELTLEEMLDGISDENRHREVGTGKAVGNEAW